MDELLQYRGGYKYTILSMAKLTVWGFIFELFYCFLLLFTMTFSVTHYFTAPCKISIDDFLLLFHCFFIVFLLLFYWYSIVIWEAFSERKRCLNSPFLN